MNVWRKPVLVLALAWFLTAPFGAVAAEMHGAIKEAPMPAANGKDLWTYLQKVNYRVSFALWPGKGEFYKGREPHGALLTTYGNRQALDAIRGKKGKMAAESIVVKENYKLDKTLAAITVMYKVAGFDPAGGDWFWVKYAADGKVLAEGKPQGCISCHGRKKENDWLFTGELK